MGDISYSFYQTAITRKKAAIRKKKIRCIINDKARKQRYLHANDRGGFIRKSGCKQKQSIITFNKNTLNQFTN